MIIREYTSADCNSLAELFYNTVHSINEKDYSEEQLNVWATGRVNFEAWNRSFLEHFTVVAVDDDVIVGFGDIDKTGYLDRLFVHKNYQKRGVAKAICDELEKKVNTERFITHASITARPFFEKRGYRVLKEQQVEREGIILLNYVMEK
ncbi:GNAT family N-acetyltransferase [Clostridium botulinum]|uniref:GNAT family N-acetyltransferase n=1 Tax=Clostridium sp. VAP51 TaxID=2949978 RepID=UPI0013FBF409|nr:GNAT family N-acetyltransferase [Clostridium sp. VAP51]NFN95738.1 GNAT family N-acetyltransferase [Clostridium botulinum]NFS96863.1 GNAT family N-acetyltransferase [Clostridium botulinum]